MNATKAMAVVEQEFGSLDDFAYSVLTDEGMKVALDESKSLILRAEAVGLPLRVFSRILNSPAFKAALRTSIVNTEFGFYDEQRHVQEIVKVAKGEERKVMSPKGIVGLVDPNPSDIIAAGRYLNDLRGTTVDGKTGPGGASVNIQIVNANSGESEGPTITVEANPAVHQPQRAGGLPPRGVRERGSASSPSPVPPPLLGDGSGGSQRSSFDDLANLTGFGKKESRDLTDQLEADALSRVHSPIAVGVDDRRKVWGELPDRPKPSAPPEPGRYTDD